MSELELYIKTHVLSESEENFLNDYSNYYNTLDDEEEIEDVLSKYRDGIYEYYERVSGEEFAEESFTSSYYQEFMNLPPCVTKNINWCWVWDDLQTDGYYEGDNGIIYIG